jgi:hypothetical protein
MRKLLAVLTVAVALAGCGGSPGDLLAIEVSGGAANRDQEIVIRSDGHAGCNGGATDDIGSNALIEAREIERELADDAERAAVYERGAPDDATSYAVRTKDGTVRWRERARGLPAVYPRAQLFALQQGRALCR